MCDSDEEKEKRLKMIGQRAFLVMAAVYIPSEKSKEEREKKRNVTGVSDE